MNNPMLAALLGNLIPPEPRIEPNMPNFPVQPYGSPNLDLSSYLQQPAELPLGLSSFSADTEMPDTPMGAIPEPPRERTGSFKETLGQTLGDFMFALGEGLKNRGKRGQSTGAGAAMQAPAHLAMQRRQEAVQQQKMAMEQQQAKAKAAMENVRLQLEQQRVLNDTRNTESLNRNRTWREGLPQPTENVDPLGGPGEAAQIRIAQAKANMEKGNAKEPSYTAENVMVDGKPARVLRSGTDYLDATTKKPITGRITPYIAPFAPRQKGEMTDTSEANLISRLNAQWEKSTKEVQGLYRANAIMDAGMEAAKRGDMAAGAQAVLVTFQKFLDPLSVVRESEYARSAAGQAVADRIRGYVEQLAIGGAGVPLAELQKFADIGRDINSRLAKEGDSLVSSEKGRIARVASRYNIPDELIFSGYEFDKGNSPAPTGGSQPKTMILNGKTLTLGPDGKYR